VEKPDGKINAFLKKVSVGSYSTKLYFGGNQRSSSYSSVAGGIVTLIGYFVFSVLAIIIFIQTFQRKDYTFSQSFIPLLQTTLPKTLKLHAFRGSLISQTLYVPTQDATSCKDKKIMFIAYPGLMKDGETSVNASFSLVAQGVSEFKALGIDDHCAFKPDGKEF